jgi:hypothetical protein
VTTREPAAPRRSRTGATLLAVMLALAGPPLLTAAGVLLAYRVFGGADTPGWLETTIVIAACAVGVFAVGWLLRACHPALRIVVPLAYLAAMAYPVMLAGFMGALCAHHGCRW